MRFRKLRIAFSTVCSIAQLAMLVRWTLRPTKLDLQNLNPPYRFGTFAIETAPPSVAPFWLTIILFAALAAAPWIPWSRRFSLRTLLIAMTLVAVGLGLFVASS